MKLIRLFVGFVVVSLVVGIGSAFNGQSTVSQIDEKPEISTETVEKTESKTEQNEVQETKNVDNPSEEKKNNSNSFSDSKKSTNKTETKNNETSTTKQENKNIIQNNKIETNQNTNTQVKQEEKKEQPVKDNKPNTSNVVTPTPKYDADTKQDCYNLGNRITNNELDYILDWNEQHPNDLKQPIIDNPSCHEVFVNGVSKWYLHFTTSNGVDMDEYLKNVYK